MLSASQICTVRYSSTIDKRIPMFVRAIFLGLLVFLEKPNSRSHRSTSMTNSTLKLPIYTLGCSKTPASRSQTRQRYASSEASKFRTCSCVEPWRSGYGSSWMESFWRQIHDCLFEEMTIMPKPKWEKVIKKCEHVENKTSSQYPAEHL